MFCSLPSTDAQAKGGNPADQAQTAKAQTLLELKHDIVVHCQQRYSAIIKGIIFPPIQARRSV